MIDNVYVLLFGSVMPTFDSKKKTIADDRQHAQAGVEGQSAGEYRNQSFQTFQSVCTLVSLTVDRVQGKTFFILFFLTVLAKTWKLKPVLFLFLCTLLKKKSRRWSLLILSQLLPILRETDSSLCFACAHFWLNQIWRAEKNLQADEFDCCSLPSPKWISSVSSFAFFYQPEQWSERVCKMERVSPAPFPGWRGQWCVRAHFLHLVPPTVHRIDVEGQRSWTDFIMFLFDPSASFKIELPMILM